MAIPRLFVSSTCYDLNILRAELRSFVTDHGFEPVMSEYSDVLFDPRHHTHTSCIQEITTCDMLIFIIGSRFGGQSVPEALGLVNLDKIDSLKEKENLSITQLEVLRAIEAGIPVFTFVLEGILNDHKTYERNKENPILKQIEFPNIERQETSKYIFEFINFIRLKSSGNSITPFSKLEDIKEHLRKQWAALFQRLLYEQRYKKEDQKRIDFLTNQIADLKTAVLTSLSTSELKSTAKAAIKYRRLIDVLSSIYRGPDDSFREVMKQNLPWNKLIADVFEVTDFFEDKRRDSAYRAILTLKDGTYFATRFAIQFLTRLGLDWDEFRQVQANAKDAIINAVLDTSDKVTMFHARHFAEPYMEDQDQSKAEDEIPF